MTAILKAALALGLLLPPTLARAQSAMPGMGMPTPAPAQTSSADDDPKGTDQSPGSAPAPAPQPGRAADAYWSAEAMAHAEMAMMAPPLAHYGAMKVDLAEYQFGKGSDSFRWEGEGWVGDLNRFLLRTRGDGPVGGRLDDAEIEAAYARAVSPWWNVELGVRQDIRPTPARTHAMLALEGTMPYNIGLLASAYLSDKGQLTTRIEATLDQRVTRRLVLQPRAELNLSAQDMPAERLGAGLTNAELGLRLRAEITPKFAPYVGLSWSWAAGRTAGYLRDEGNNPASRVLVLGLKSWF